MFSKIIFIIILVAIIISLGSALYHLVRDDASSERTVRALTWRTLLSIALFLLLLLAFRFDLLQPHAPAFSVPVQPAPYHQ